jgi:hypothetical protein
MRTIFWLAGGLSVGLGMVTLASYGFDQPGGEVAASFSQLGFDALPTLSMTTSGWVGLMLVALGAVLMIKANATAWKQTGGY